jgi:hypothetical protein
MCIGFLIIAEAKPKKDDLMVYVYDLDEWEFVKNTNFILSSHWKIKYDRMVSNRTDEVILE